MARLTVRRIGRGLLKAAAWTGAGLVVLVLALLLCINLPFGREFIRKQVNSALATTFVGELTIDRIGSIGPMSIGGVSAHMLDQHRKRILLAQGLGLRANWPSLVLAMVRGKPQVLQLTPVGCDHIELTLRDDGSGSPSIASAFLPRDPSPPSSEPSTLTVKVEDIELNHVWVHGAFGSVPPLDGEFKKLRANLVSTPDKLELLLDGVDLKLRGLPVRVDPSGRLQGKLVVPGNSPDLNASVQFKGKLARGDAQLRAELVGKALKAALELRDVPAEFLRELAPDLTLQTPTTVLVSASGSLDRLAFDATIQNAAANLKLTGEAALGETQRIRAELQGRDIDAAGFVASAPRTDLSPKANAELVLSPNGAMSGTYALMLPAASVDAVATPQIAVKGELQQAPKQPLTTRGTLHVAEPGAATDIEYDVVLDEQQRVHARLATTLREPPRAKKLAGVRVNGKLNAEAELQLTSKQFRADATADLDAVSLPQASARRIQLRASAHGSFADPNFEAEVTARELVAADRKFSKAVVHAAGRPQRLTVRADLERTNGQVLRAESVVSARTSTDLLGPRLSLKSSRGALYLRANRVRILPDGVQADEFELTGAGTAAGSVVLRGGQIDANVAFGNLDLGRVAQISEFELPIQHGLVNGDARVKRRAGRWGGTVRIKGSDIAFQKIQHGTIETDLTLTDRVIDGTISASYDRSQITAKLQQVDVPDRVPAGDPLSALRGSLDVSGNFALDQMAPVLRAAGVPLEQARGQLELSLQASNPRNQRSQPTLQMRLKTHDLKLVQQRPPLDEIEGTPRARETQPLSLVGVDVDLTANIDATDRKADLQARLLDQHGTLLTLTASSDNLDLGAGGAALQRAPIKVIVQVPQRELDRLPLAVRPQAVRGLMALEVNAEGSIAAPQVKAKLNLQRISARGRRRGVNGDASLELGPNGGKLLAAADFRGASVMKLETRWQGDLIRRVQAEAETQKPAFVLDTDLSLYRFPLQVVAPLSDRQIRGPLSGTVQLRNLGKAATLDVKLNSRELKLGEEQLPGFELTAKTEQDKLVAEVSALQSKGKLNANFTTPMKWNDELAPAIDSHAQARIKAERFDLSALLPFVAQYVSTLEGELDADLNLDLRNELPDLRGSASLRKGVVQLPQIGQRFSDVTLRVAVGNGEVRIDDVQARGISGRVTASARARIAGAELQSIKAQLDIKENEKLPLVFEGVAFGDGYGHVDFAYETKDRVTDIKVDVPRFHVIMPDSSVTSVQSLTRAEYVRVGVHREDGKFVAMPDQPLGNATKDGQEEPTTTNVRIKLGDNVWLERGQQALVQLTGDIGVKSGAASSVIEGRIELRGGKLDVNGKKFEVERGVVTLNGKDPSNPTITALARWDAPGYSVYAEYRGTAQAGKLILRSEPQLTQAEIVSLLVVGSPEGQLGSSSGGGTAATAVGVAGDTAVRGFNRVMSDFTHLDVSARIDTSTGSARPELVVQISPRVTTRITQALGAPAPNQPPDRTFLTVELRLQRAWALSAVVGDRGASALDLIWRRRY